MSERESRARFESLVLPHLDAAYNFARWLTRNHHDAEDVVQEAMLRAYRYVDALRGAAARPWLLTIVRRTCYDWLATNRPSEIDPTADPESNDFAISSSMGPEESAIRNAETLVLSTAIAALPVGFREVLILRELEELSYKEIARIVDIPIGTVMSRLARARGMLQNSPLLESVRGTNATGKA